MNDTPLVYIRISDGIRQFYYCVRELSERELKSIPNYYWIDEQVVASDDFVWTDYYKKVQDSKLDQALKREREATYAGFVDDLKSKKSSTNKSWSFGTFALAQSHTDETLDELITKYSSPPETETL